VLPAAGRDDRDRAVDLLERSRHRLGHLLGERARDDPVDRPDPGLADGLGDVGVRHERKDDIARVVEDLAGVAVVGVHVERAPFLPGEGVLARPGGLLEVGPRRLRGVPDHGPRRRAPPAGDHPPLHRREVLGLVDEHVRVPGGALDAAEEQPLAGVGGCDDGTGLGAAAAPVGAGAHVDDTPRREVVELLDVVEAGVLPLGLGYGAEPREQVVDERDVGHRPLAGLERLAVGPREGGALLVVEHPAREGVDVLGVGEREQQLTRVERTPPRRHELVDLPGGLEGVEEGVPLALAHRAPGRLGQGGAGGLVGEVVLVGAEHLRAHPAQDVDVEAHRVPCDEGAQRSRSALGRARREPAEQLPHPQRALERGHLRVVQAGGGHPVDDVPEGPQCDGLLAEAREDALDVGGVRGRRPDDQDSAVLEPPALRVEQVGGTVEGDHRLAGAGSTGDLGDPARRCPDGLVLVALDRRDDVAHLPATAAGQRRHERTVADDDDVVRGGRDHEVVLHPHDPRTAAAQHPAPHDAHRVDRRGPVERRCRRGTPVDDERLVVVVAHPEAPDVADVPLVGARLLGAEVEPAEDQPLVLGVDHGASAGSGIDESVALEQPGHLLVADITGAVGATPGEAVGLDVGGSPGRLGELGVDPVDVVLLAGDLGLDVRRGARETRGGGGHEAVSPQLAPVYGTAQSTDVPSRRCGVPRRGPVGVDDPAGAGQSLPTRRRPW
jgi:hypothetical protein